MNRKRMLTVLLGLLLVAMITACSTSERPVDPSEVEVTLTTENSAAIPALERFAEGAVHTSHDGRRLRAPVRSEPGLATKIVRALDDAGVTIDDVQVHQPSLDDVFFALTGHPAEEETSDREEAEAA